MRLSPHALLLAPLLVTACGASRSEPTCPTLPPATAASASAERPAPPPPTVDEARAFVARVSTDLRELWVARDRAGWVSNNFITYDTEALAAAGEEATASYVGRAIHEATRFDGMKLPDDLARQLWLLKLSQTVPAPADAAARAELASVEASMTSAYGKGKYCPPKGSKLAPLARGGPCLTLDDLSRVMRTSRDEGALLEAWVGWHAIGAPLRRQFARYVELGNEGAREIGFADMGALWRSGYDMPPDAFEADVERLWRQVQPLYDQLHCYVRARLRDKYGDKVPAHGPIPAHLLGNMWAQDWSNVYDLVAPFPKEPSIDVSKALVSQKWDAIKMVKLGESFFTSLGFEPLPRTFWERSLFTRPRDREVVCHASAWDVSWSDDLRIKMCIEPTEEDLITIHHELGHDFYFHEYRTLPILFQGGANDGFHEGIGDTLALSVTPSYLKQVGLLREVPQDDRARLDAQMKSALDKIAFLPFGLLIDKWRWDVFSGKTPEAGYEAAWWSLREKYQGVSAPLPRSESDFDPGAKFHVPASTPYARYFLARIYQFQFHRALCKAAGYTGPLDQCSIHGNEAAGQKLIAMLRLGQSRPWQEAMKAISGEDAADASAMLEYYAPLTKWLGEQNAGRTCGW